MLPFIKSAIAAAALALAAGAASAANVAIVTGSFYTPDLRNELISAGQTVTEISNYTAASLASFDAVIHYGNSFTDVGALTTYATGGGTVVLTPWAGLNFSLNTALQVFTNGGTAQFSIANPGVTALDAGDPLLDGIALPAAGGVNIGRISNILFASGVHQVAEWADGVDMIGHKAVGAGNVIGINMHVITSDTAFGVIHQPWARDLFVNAVNFGTAEVPEPASLALIAIGLLSAGAARRRKSPSATAA